jgi:hypothetical protein
MAFAVVKCEPLRHNPLNQVTGSVERVTDAAGATLIRKVLRRPDPAAGRSPAPWSASLDPRHWNYWRREAEAYRSGVLRDSLQQAGWHGDENEVRLGMVASCVKYAWLLPLMLKRAADDQHRAYQHAADSAELYRQRGLALRHLVCWLDEALTRAATPG